MAGRAEYMCWHAMLQRCTNPRAHNYRLYGGRGITVTPRWMGPDGYATFLKDMGRRPGPRFSLDRIDNSQGYAPENCRWATQTQQMRNTRNNRLITINGETKPLVVWAEVFGIPHQQVRNRIYRGWGPIRALVTPMVSMPQRSWSKNHG